MISNVGLYQNFQTNRLPANQKLANQKLGFGGLSNLFIADYRRVDPALLERFLEKITGSRSTRTILGDSWEARFRKGPPLYNGTVNEDVVTIERVDGTELLVSVQGRKSKEGEGPVEISDTSSFSIHSDFDGYYLDESGDIGNSMIQALGTNNRSGNHEGERYSFIINSLMRHFTGPDVQQVKNNKITVEHVASRTSTGRFDGTKTYRDQAPPEMDSNGPKTIRDAAPPVIEQKPAQAVEEVSVPETVHAKAKSGIFRRALSGLGIGNAGKPDAKQASSGKTTAQTVQGKAPAPVPAPSTPTPIASNPAVVDKLTVCEKAAPAKGTTPKVAMPVANPFDLHGPNSLVEKEASRTAKDKVPPAFVPDNSAKSPYTGVAVPYERKDYGGSTPSEKPATPPPVAVSPVLQPPASAALPQVKPYQIPRSDATPAAKKPGTPAPKVDNSTGTQVLKVAAPVAAAPVLAASAGQLTAAPSKPAASPEQRPINHSDTIGIAETIRDLSAPVPTPVNPSATIGTARTLQGLQPPKLTPANIIPIPPSNPQSTSPDTSNVGLATTLLPIAIDPKTPKQ